jgi:L-ascorbate metabolism protein UlaG (beta-lactamase superfamily)
VKIKWLGHSCFLLTSDQGVKLLTDPFHADSSSGLKYAEVKESVDLVTVSHDHFDHNNTEALPGKPEILKGRSNKTIKDVSISGIASYHDETKGSQRGANTIFCFDVDGIVVCHLGDLGHDLGKDEIGKMGQVDILLIPIGEVFTIGVDTAGKICNEIKPRMVFPMHYKTDQCGWLKFGVEDFIKDKSNVRKLSVNEVEVKKETLPQQMEIVVLKYTG